MFQLHPSLQKKAYVCDLPFSTVLFEDNVLCPWIFLVPKKENVRNMLDLTTEERLTLMREIELAEKVMTKLFNPTQTNVAMIGNLTPQLHVHVICRYETDPYWPGTVWNQPGKPYLGTAKQDVINRIKKEFEECQK
ncbi:MAG: HIT family protein [Alphaproteobacteria bacterium]|nr:HIT family protein [Alphaproteobacteria bacterium]